MISVTFLYKIGDLENAVKTAHTYWLRHIGDDIIEDSIEYYKNLTEAKPEYFIDLEAAEHIWHYDEGCIIFGLHLQYTLD